MYILSYRKFISCPLIFFLHIIDIVLKYSELFVLESGKVGGTFKENEKLKKEIRRLEEENNLLKLKFDVLLDMVTLFMLHFLEN